MTRLETPESFNLPPPEDDACDLLIIAGEHSGDEQAARMMRRVLEKNPDLRVCALGGKALKRVGVQLLFDMTKFSVVGLMEVLKNYSYFKKLLAEVYEWIAKYKPRAVCFVDYPGFNLGIAKFLRANTSIPVFYYISPKIWAWKEYRIKNIRRDVSAMFSILPFEVPFYEEKHHYPVHYVGNPTADEVSEFLAGYCETTESFCRDNSLSVGRKIIALLAGSRRQEIKDNLPAMLKAASRYAGEYQLVVAGAPSIPQEYYSRFTEGYDVRIVFDKTYPLLAHSCAALVTSGTATLETALFNVPQVVCYETPVPKLISFLRRHLLKVKYISLVNLIAGHEVVKELVADTFTVENIAHELGRILPGGSSRRVMLDGYAEVWRRLGKKNAPDNAAETMVRLLRKECEH